MAAVKVPSITDGVDLYDRIVDSLKKTLPDLKVLGSQYEFTQFFEKYKISTSNKVSDDKNRTVMQVNRCGFEQEVRITDDVKRSNGKEEIMRADFDNRVRAILANLVKTLEHSKFYTLTVTQYPEPSQPDQFVFQVFHV